MRKVITLILIFGCFITSFSQNKGKITLEDIFVKFKYRASFINEMIHLKDGIHYASLDDNENLIKYNYLDGKAGDTIFIFDNIKSKLSAKNISLFDMKFSPDETKILLALEREKLFRVSAKYNYYIYDILTKKVIALSDGGKQQYAVFSPVGDKIAFVKENNIFIKSINSNDELKITSDGLANKISNGIPDWVYEEEFGMGRAFEWSPGGDYIAYLKFDETNVKEYELLFYGNQYPEIQKYKYPKAGEQNSIVKLFIYNMKNGETKPFDIEDSADRYIPKMKWTINPEILSVTKLNRLQNKMDIIFVDAKNNSIKNILTEENKCYVDVKSDLFFLKDNSFIKFSERDGFTSLYLFSPEGTVKKRITDGKYDVINLEGFDEKNNIIYYSSYENSSIEKYIYKIKLDGTGKTQITDFKGYNNAEFSVNFQYFIHTYSSAIQPSKSELCNNEGNIIRELGNNDKLLKIVQEDGFVQKEFINFKISENVDLNGWILKPAKIENGKKYPLLMYVYGGPGSQSVLNAWSSGMDYWYQYLVQNGYIVACVDNRGTGGRGEAFKKCTYMNLGVIEIEDQIEAAKYFASLPYIDGGRIGMFGWSYGGYMTCLAVTKGSKYFKTGLAVAPVTDWQYYDNIYTERYMRRPIDNSDGYKNGSPVNFAKDMNSNLLIVHGSADDNVHTQNTFDFVSALIKENKQFEMFIYPNKNHGISGGNTRYHLFKKLTDFLFKNL
jgi:dipeptidyl-peptidase-4